jgi:hypothetical protein
MKGAGTEPFHYRQDRLLNDARTCVRLLGFVWVILSRVEGFLVGAAKDAGGRRVS